MRVPRSRASSARRCVCFSSSLGPPNSRRWRSQTRNAPQASLHPWIYSPANCSRFGKLITERSNALVNSIPDSVTPSGPSNKLGFALPLLAMRYAQRLRLSDARQRLGGVRAHPVILVFGGGLQLGNGVAGRLGIYPTLVDAIERIGHGLADATVAIRQQRQKRVHSPRVPQFAQPISSHLPHIDVSILKHREQGREGFWIAHTD